MKIKYCPYLDGDSPQVNHSFHQENEKLRALCVAQEAEIARLQRGFDELKAWAKSEHEGFLNKDYSDYHRGAFVMSGLFIENINRITGENK